MSDTFDQDLAQMDQSLGIETETPSEQETQAPEAPQTPEQIIDDSFERVVAREQ